MQLLRTVIGDVLRDRRVEQGRTLRDVAAAAGVSLGYLSEIERGRKEASSELLAAICTSLGASLAEVFHDVSEALTAAEARRTSVFPVGFTMPRSAPAPRPVAGVPPLRLAPSTQPAATAPAGSGSVAVPRASTTSAGPHAQVRSGLPVVAA